MAVQLDSDSDRPAGAGRLGSLHLRAGRAVISAVNLLRPRVTLGVRLLALDPEGKIFLIRHSYVPGYHLPGGGVSPGETTREAVIREAQEEGGLICPEPPTLFGIYLNRALADRDHVAVFVSRGVQRDPSVSGGFEVAAAGFHAPGSLPDDTTPATRARIGEILGGQSPSQYW